VLFQGGKRDAEVARDESGAFAFQKREDSVRMFRLVERPLADTERLLCLGEDRRRAEGCMLRGIVELNVGLGSISGQERIGSSRP
jgi:hypothetical protein